jgi:ABC-2 type transport system permease protein
VSRDDPLLPNAATVARREFGERVGSRLFHMTTVLLAALGVLTALLPLFARAIDRGSTSTIAVVAQDESLAQSTIIVLSFLNTAAAPGQAPQFTFVTRTDANAAESQVAQGSLDGALIATRGDSGRLDFQLLTGETLGQERVALIQQIGTFSVGVLDWMSTNGRPGAPSFLPPSVHVQSTDGPTAGGAPPSASEFAGRRIVGVVFVVLIFITLVIYGMWVAAGVVAEKSSRVMELMISAASARQLVVGKVVGIGLAGLTQTVLILAPAVIALLVEDPLARWLFGAGAPVVPGIAGLSFGLIGAFLAFFVLGFTLYALIYAAAGSLVSRAEDLQMLALPLSLIAIIGYLQAVLALTGGTGGFVRTASLVPFWSPFIMLTRLAVGRVEAWELIVAIALLIAMIAVTFVVAVRVYSAGVLLYGQRPGLRAIVSAVVSAR